MLIVTNDPQAPEQRLTDRDDADRFKVGDTVDIADRDHRVVARARVESVEGAVMKLAKATPVEPFYAWAGGSTVIASQPDVTAPTPIRPEQERFRKNLLKAYRGRCAVTGCDIEQLLDAAHLRPWQVYNQVSDGILLRTDIHRLLEAGLLTISRDHRVATQARGYENLDGIKLRLPKRRQDWPKLA